MNTWLELLSRTKDNVEDSLGKHWKDIAQTKQPLTQETVTFETKQKRSILIRKGYSPTAEHLRRLRY